MKNTILGTVRFNDIEAYLRTVVGMLEERPLVSAVKEAS